jgi:hypothetical protein
MRDRAFPIVATFALLSICGACNRNSLDLQAISGKVSFDSRPLVSGAIRFTPATQSGLATGSAIADGMYRIPWEKGLPPGTYKVQISAADVPPGFKPVPIGGEIPPSKELIPEKYNLKSELSVEVKSGGRNTFNFDLSSRAGK